MSLAKHKTQRFRIFNPKRIRVSSRKYLTLKKKITTNVISLPHRARATQTIVSEKNIPEKFFREKIRKKSTGLFSFQNIP